MCRLVYGGHRTGQFRASSLGKNIRTFLIYLACECVDYASLASFHAGPTPKCPYVFLYFLVVIRKQGKIYVYIYIHTHIHMDVYTPFS